MNKRQHDPSYDILRLIAVFLVIFTHTGKIGSKIYCYTGLYDRSTINYIGLDIIRCVNVPLFFMVSGALLLNKEETYINFFKKRILKYILCIIIFSYLYFVTINGHPWYQFGLLMKSVYSNDTSIVPYHFWFLYVYLGYLFVIPFLRKMLLNFKTVDYLYFIVAGGLYKIVIKLIDGFAGIGCFAVPYVLCYDMFFYPVLGYFLGKILSEKNFKVKYALIGILLSVISVAITGYIMVFDYRQKGNWSELYLDLFTLLPTMTLFYCCKLLTYRVKFNEILIKILAFLGDKVFGIYIFSVLFESIAWKAVYLRLEGYINPLVDCFIMVTANMILGTFVTTIIKKIPVLGKLL